MKGAIDKKQFLIFIAIVLIVSLLFTGLYFWQISPLNTQITTKETELSNQEKQMEALNAELSSTGTTSFATTVELQKQLPVKEAVDQLVLNLEKAEVISGSAITTMAFVDGEVTLSEEESAAALAAANAKAVEASDATAGETNEQAVTTEEEPVNEEGDPSAEVDVLPQGVKKVSVAMTVQSPAFFEMEAFLESLHSMKRILKVDNLTFNGSEEIHSIEQSSDKLEYQLTISVFYAPNLSDLQDQMPTIEAPKPSNKRDPFNNSPVVKEKAESGDDES
ncbi:GspMb/PilO family protein [Peribacillus psychrosaccharolyticus]|uniref:GspMb/PilO family protein n=1 Tax=Peribacillus psychrosaccharolyticus TaxID=1407 RepID=UPI003D2A4D08